MNRLHYVPALLLLLALGVAASNRTYVFGVNLGLNASESGAYYPAQVQTLQGYTLWRDWWNDLPEVLRTTQWGDVISVELHVEQFSDFSYANALPGLQNAYYSMSQNSSIDYYFCTSGLDGVQIRDYTYNNLSIPIMMSAVDSNEPYYSIPGSFGTPTANIFTMTSWLPYLRVAAAQTIALVQVNDGVWQSEMCAGVASQAPLNGLEVVLYEQNMPFDWWTVGAIDGVANRSQVWTNVLDQIIGLNPDAVVICDYSYGAKFALEYFRTQNWTPKSMAISPIEITFDDPSLLDYIVTPSTYSAAAHYSAQANFTDSAGFDALVQAKFGVHATPALAQATLAGMLYTYALTNADSDAPADVVTALRTSQFTSFMGVSAFDVKDRQTMQALVTQLMDSGNKTNVIGPALASAAAFVYPAPTWQQRVFNPKWGSGVEIAAAVLMAIGGAVILAWTIFLLMHHNHPVMMAASPVFCAGILFGGLMVFVSIFTWMPNLINSTAVCMLRTWLLPLGFMIMFGSMLAKTDRICRIYYGIYQSKTAAKVIKISNGQVALIVVAIAIVQCILSVLMTTVTGIESTIHVVDQYRVSNNFWVCSFSKTLKVLFGINVAYGGLLLLWGTYLAFRIRKVPISAYDESKIIGFSIYNSAFFGVIVIVIQLAVGNSNRDVTFIITAVCCFLGAVITTSTLFASKAFAIYKPGYLEDSTHSSSMTPYQRSGNAARETSNAGSRSMSEDGTRRKKNDLESQIKDLQKTNASLEETNQELNDEVKVQKKKIKALKKKIKALEAGAHEEGEE